MLDAEVFGAELAGLIKEHVAHAVAPLLAKIQELEVRAPRDGKDGVNGKDADPNAIHAAVAKAVSEIPKPKDFDREFATAELQRMVGALVLPEGKSGERGSSFSAGNGPPTSFEKIGDIYLDVDSGDVYRCH